MINIKHCYAAHVSIEYDTINEPFALNERITASMDDIAEHACEVLIKHNFERAIVCSATTGEVMIEIERS